MRYLPILLLAGCSTTWVHPTKDEQDLKVDRYECNRDAMGAGVMSHSMFKMCMDARGWKS